LKAANTVCSAIRPTFSSKTTRPSPRLFENASRSLPALPYVPEPLAMRNKNNAILYYLFFAAANRTADKIIRDIFTRYRS
jgi:hypothetical protein